MAHQLARLSNLGYAVLKKELEIPKDDQEWFKELLAAYNNDFWQNGKGSMLPPPTGAASSEISTKLKDRFVFRNVIKECVERVSGAFFGKSPDWSIASEVSRKNPEDVETPEATEISPVEKAMGDWWTENNASAEIAKAFESRLVVGRGGLRIYVPARYNALAANDEQETQQDQEVPEGSGEDSPKFDQTPNIEFASLEEALAAIRIEYVPPDRSKFLDDEGEVFSVVEYCRRKDWNNRDTVNVIEFSFVDDDGRTFVGLVEENNDPTNGVFGADLSTPLELDENLTFNEFCGEPYVTQALYRNNKLLNLALTCAGFSLVDNGFGEVFLSNVEAEMVEVDDPGSDTGKKLVPKSIKRGGAMIQNLIGITTEDQEGNETRLTPGVTFKEPSALQAFKDGKDIAYTSCLEEAGQLYAKISGDAVASGESRIQAMADFWIKIRKYKPDVDEIGSWVLTSVLLLAAELCNQTEKFRGSGVTYDAKVFIGPVTPTERDQIMRMRDDGVISWETASVLLGVEDPELEKAKMVGERKVGPFEAVPADFDKKLDTAMKMQGLFPMTYIYEYLGIDSEEDRKKIVEAMAAEAGVLNPEPGLTDDLPPAGEEILDDQELVQV